MKFLRSSISTIALSSLLFSVGCANVNRSPRGAPPPPASQLPYDRDDLIKEPKPVSISTKAPRADGESHLRHDKPDAPLYKRPDSEEGADAEPKAGENLKKKEGDKPLWERP